MMLAGFVDAKFGERAPANPVKVVAGIPHFGSKPGRLFWLV
jgi:hypothetical protein